MSYEDGIKRHSKWLADLKPGDKACIPGYGLTKGDYTTVTVSRITPTGRIVVVNQNGHETTYDSRGRSMGSGKWNFSNLAEITDDMRAERNMNRMRRRVRDIEVTQLTDDQVRRLYAVLKQFDDESKPEESNESSSSTPSS